MVKYKIQGNCDVVYITHWLGYRSTWAVELWIKNPISNVLRCTSSG